MTLEKKKEHIITLSKDLESLLDNSDKLKASIDYNKSDYSLYGDYLDFFNHQIASIDTVLSLLRENRYKDSFTLIRSLFEFYLVYMLMTKGKYYFQIVEKEKNKKTIEQYNDLLEYQRNNPSKYYQKFYIYDGRVRIKREGPYIDGKKGKSRLVPFYYSVFRDFDSTAANLLKDDNFRFIHTWSSKEFVKRDHKRNKDIYRAFLSFDSVLHSLQINRFCTKKTRLYISAHYDFLSKFIHPSSDALGIINDNKVDGYKPYNKIFTYNDDLYLLGLLYSGFILCGISETIVSVFSNASKHYIKNFDDSLKQNINNFYDRYSYFWFIYNGPHEFDRFYIRSFIYERRNAKKRVRFNTNILQRLKDLQRGMERVDGTEKYCPPFVPDIS